MKFAMLHSMLLLSAIIGASYEVTYPCNSLDVCGCSSYPASMTRIVGGETAASATWSWAVSLFIDRTYLCGGSIISSSWIITAAHCVNDVIASNITIYAGSNLRWSGTQTRVASKVIVHSSYNSDTYVNDIALLQLSSPLSMTDPNVSQICLPSISSSILSAGEWPPIGTNVVAVGWGTLSFDGSLPQTMQQVTVKTIDYLSPTCKLIEDWHVQVCAGVPGGGKDTCRGDSGGPLMMFTSSNQWVLIGLTSSGFGCAEADYMGIYTRVAAFETWIRSYTNDSFTTPRNLTASSITLHNNTIPIAILFSVNYYYFFVVIFLLIKNHL